MLETILSLPERRLKNALGRFPDLGFNLLAAPSRPDLDFRFQIFDFRFKSKIPNPKSKIPLSSDLRCGFRRHYSGGTAPDFHRSSLTPRASNIEAKATSRKKRCQALFPSVAFSRPSFYRSRNFVASEDQPKDQRNRDRAGGETSVLPYKDAKRTKLKVSLNSMTAPKLSASMEPFRLRR
jgi:hypothetical protein